MFIAVFKGIFKCVERLNEKGLASLKIEILEMFDILTTMIYFWKLGKNLKVVRFVKTGQILSFHHALHKTAFVE